MPHYHQGVSLRSSEIVPLPPEGIRAEGLVPIEREVCSYREAPLHTHEPVVLTCAWGRRHARLAQDLVPAVLVGLVVAAGSARMASVGVLWGAVVSIVAWVCWRALGEIFNRTVIVAHEGALDIAHGPFTFERPERLAVEACDGVLVRVTTHQNRSGESVRYGLVVRSRVRGEVVVVADAPMAQVNFVAWVLSRCVGIPALATQRL